MSKRQLLMILGVLVMITMYLGIGEGAKKIVLLVLGALIIGISYRVMPPRATSASDEKPFIDNHSG